MSQDVPRWGAGFDHLVRWMVGSPDLQRCFFFVIVRNLWGDTLRLCEYSVPHDPMISASIMILIRVSYYIIG